MSKGLRALIIILLIICVGVFIFAGYKFISKEIEYKTSEKFYNDMSGKYTTSSSTSSTASTQTVAEDQGIVLDDEVSPISTDWNTLLNDYPDIIGWIYLPDTVINYPMARYDDNSYFLNRQLDGSYNSSGTIFMECMNQKDFSDNNTIIYGHHMNDGSMFAKLIDYNYQNFYDEHPNMYINTPTYNYRVEVFAAFVTSASSETYNITLGNELEWQTYLDNAISQSLVKTNVDVKPGDNIVTFSTCTYEYDDARFVVQGKLVPIH